MQVHSISKNVPMSAQKMREVVRQIQGLPALQAQAVLAVVPRKGARLLVGPGPFMSWSGGHQS